MRVKLILNIILIAWIGNTMADSHGATDEERIRDLVANAYVNGAFNDLDTEAMRAGFNSAFAINGVADGTLSQYPIDEWIKATERRKNEAGYERQTWTYEIPLLDITGHAAVVKIELSHDGKHVYTDYLSLLKFEAGWQITDKVYFKHP